MRIGFAGSGRMAAAMARGWASAPDRSHDLAFTDAGSGRARQLAEELGGTVAGSVEELVGECEVVVLAVKPAALTGVAPQLAEARLVISVLAATTLERLREALGTPVIRAMLSVAAELRASVICHARLGEPEAELGPAGLDLLAELGELVELPDELIDPATAVMGCAPAYIAMVAEAIADAGAEAGLGAELARSLITETLASTALLLREHSPEEVRGRVASPGGITEVGLETLASARVPEGFTEAVRATLERMRG